MVLMDGVVLRFEEKHAVTVYDTKDRRNIWMKCGQTGKVHVWESTAVVEVVGHL